MANTKSTCIFKVQCEVHRKAWKLQATWIQPRSQVPVLQQQSGVPWMSRGAQGGRGPHPCPLMKVSRQEGRRPLLPDVALGDVACVQLGPRTGVGVVSVASSGPLLSFLSCWSFQIPIPHCGVPFPNLSSGASPQSHEKERENCHPTENSKSPFLPFFLCGKSWPAPQAHRQGASLWPQPPSHSGSRMASEGPSLPGHRPLLSKEEVILQNGFHSQLEGPPHSSLSKPGSWDSRQTAQNLFPEQPLQPE